MDPYKVLGVAPGTELKAVRKAYKRLVLKYHPDRNKDPGAEARFKEIQAAFKSLERGGPSRHDGFGGGHHSSSGAGPVFRWADSGPEIDFGDIWSHLRGRQGFSYGYAGPRSSHRMPHAAEEWLRNRSTAHVQVALTPEDAVAGCDRRFKVNLLLKCGTCNGKGTTDLSSADPCGRCRARGWLYASGPDNRYFKECPQCSGTGVVQATPCEDCGGAQRLAAKFKMRVTLPSNLRRQDTLRKRGLGHYCPILQERGELRIHADIQEW